MNRLDSSLQQKYHSLCTLNAKLFRLPSQSSAPPLCKYCTMDLSGAVQVKGKLN